MTSIVTIISISVIITDIIIIIIISSSSSSTTTTTTTTTTTVLGALSGEVRQKGRRPPRSARHYCNQL